MKRVLLLAGISIVLALKIAAQEMPPLYGPLERSGTLTDTNFPSLKQLSAQKLVQDIQRFFSDASIQKIIKDYYTINPMGAQFVPIAYQYAQYEQNLSEKVHLVEEQLRLPIELKIALLETLFKGAFEFNNQTGKGLGTLSQKIYGFNLFNFLMKLILTTNNKNDQDELIGFAFEHQVKFSIHPLLSIVKGLRQYPLLRLFVHYASEHRMEDDIINAIEENTKFF